MIYSLNFKRIYDISLDDYYQKNKQIVIKVWKHKLNYNFIVFVSCTYSDITLNDYIICVQETEPDYEVLNFGIKITILAGFKI